MSEPRARCSASDLRLQWSSAHHQRRRDPDALRRLSDRVDATIASLADEIAVSAHDASRAALSAELTNVRAIAAALRRLDATG